ncbi:hypothetical protein ABFV99_20765, partial [Cytobacillus horneckiae]|uniref:hypothetical protein n=1 Tax=Cytobacillus horneckiae TaxID=549687 RepID=UPI0034CD4581
ACFAPSSIRRINGKVAFHLFVNLAYDLEGLATAARQLKCGGGLLCPCRYLTMVQPLPIFIHINVESCCL